MPVGLFSFIRAGREVTCAIIDSSPLLLRHDEDEFLQLS